MDRDALRAVLAGTDPVTGDRLSRARSDRIPGFDLTFGAPKSVSVLFGLGPFEVSAAIRAAHDAATDATLAYLERSACWSRRGGGDEPVLGAGFVGAAFRHRSSRAGDPHLHTHALVANVTCGPDGRWATLDARHLYLHAKTAGYLHGAHLRAQLTARLGVGWRPIANGTADLVGIPDRLVRAFSTRRFEIERSLAERNYSSVRSATIAKYQTRRAKDSGITATTMTQRWRLKAHSLGVAPDAMDAVVGARQVPSLGHAAIERTIEDLVGPGGLTARVSSFDRRDVLQAWCDRLPFGADVTAIEAFADRTIAAPQIVPLQAARKPSLRSVSDGRRIQGPAVGASYSTAELLALEQRVIDRAVTDRGHDVAVAAEPAVRAALAARPELSDEQTALVVRLTTSGHGVDVVVAAAGTGKTFALDAARDAWQRSGRRVVGTALAARAAAELEASAGIRSHTIASLLIDLDRSRDGGLPRHAVVVVDEAGMVGTRTLARLIDHASAARAKVVLVGDPRQLPEIDAGGVLRGLAQRVEPIRLFHNRRQREEWERDALGALRVGDVDVALRAYDAHDRVVTAPTAHRTRQVMVADWWAASLRNEQVLMVAARRYDVDDLNARARILADAAGHLTGPTLELDGRPYQAGDRVMTLRNRSRLGVRNGTIATITDVDVDGRTVTIRTDHDSTHRLPAAYLDAGYLRHAYATTIHKAQGITVDQAFVLGHATIYREAGYVALSRGRTNNRIYLVEQAERDHDHHTPEPASDPLGTLAAALQISRAQHLALDRGIDYPALQRKMFDRELSRLCDERARLEQLRTGRPHNPAAEIRSLNVVRQQLEYALRGQQTGNDALTGPHPIRHRQPGSTERLPVGDTVERLQGRLERTRHALARAHDQQRVHDTFMGVHGTELETLATIGHDIDARISRLVAGYRADPPTYLAALGP
ncbi:MAG TPA: MobF family relaxase, partial [Acidimicrobiia bacterium]|nr:MobF family relaxase [Acidimicrobiia bacterium]